MLITRRPFVGEMCVCFWDGGLIRDREHSHPPAEDAEGIDGVEGLGATADLGDGEGAALGGADTAGFKGDPVDLVFEYGGLF